MDIESNTVNYNQVIFCYAINTNEKREENKMSTKHHYFLNLFSKFYH